MKKGSEMTAKRIIAGVLFGISTTCAAWAADTSLDLPSKDSYFGKLALNRGCHGGKVKMTPAFQAYKAQVIGYYRQLQEDGKGDHAAAIRQLEADEIPKDLLDKQAETQKKVPASSFRAICNLLDSTVNTSVATGNYSMVMAKNPDPNSPEAKRAAQEMVRVMRENFQGMMTNMPEIAKGFNSDPANRKLVDSMGSPGGQAKQSAKTAPVPPRPLTPFENANILAQQGNEKAQFDMGLYYLRGQGVAKDEAKAVEWLQKSADQGYVKAQVVLGGMYEQGLDVQKDDAQAVYWLRKAAEQGDAGAQTNLGVHYVDGTGVEQDEQAGREWDQKAADQGNANAQYNLGLLYFQGKSIARDYPQAKLWFGKAASQGQSAAQFALGIMYAANVKGVPQDQQRAYYWFLVSSANGNQQANSHRDDLAKTLSKEQKDAVEAERSQCLEAREILGVHKKSPQPSWQRT